MRELERLAQEVRAQLGEPSPAWLRQQQRAVTSALGVRAPKPALGNWALAGSFLAVLLIAAVWLLTPGQRSAAPAPAPLILTASTDARRVPLADGSALLLSAHTQAQLSATDHGTSCVIELGEVLFDVAPQRGRKFVVKAGAFEVTVIGTRFSVSKDRAGVVQVAVTHGVVRVKVPGRSTPTELRAGDLLRSDGAEAVESAVPSPDAQPPLEASSKTSTAQREASWLDLYRARNYKAALAAARELGVDRLLESLAAQPLSELADAARLGGDSDLALRAFDALKRRFPGSRQAQDGLFLSGRLRASRGQLGVARGQFEAYLAGNDRGVYSVEALGRLVEIYATSKDPRAESTARAYLERAPQGPYRRLCLSVLAAP